tara:strand:+ start:1527 stop:2312 length:786 start_codon:yes stop_codon:yes gene_type:complete
LNSNILVSQHRAVALGLLTGLLNGLIALGGGVLITPFLILAGVSPQIAVGTSLVAVTILSCIGFTAHLLLDGTSMEFALIFAVCAGGVIGSVIGSKILARITPQWMLILFAIIQILVAIRLIDQGVGLALMGEVVPSIPPLGTYVGLGIFSGILSGIFGVGGGALVLLGLAAFYGLPVIEGLAIALALNVTNALVGVARHVRYGKILWSELMFIIPAALIGVVLGAALAHELPGDLMSVLFGGFFMFMGIMLARKGYRLTK